VKVLIADDDVQARETVGLLAKIREHLPIYASDGAEALEILTGDSPPLVAILNAKLPHMDGIDVCREVRLARFYPYPYLILLSPSADKEEIKAYLKAGADDYLRKPVQPDELRMRLHVADRLVGAQEKLLAALRDAEYEATHDPVTTLWNRTAILKFADQYLSKCGKSGDFLSLVLVKIAGLDQVNERYGSAIGDNLLREAADRLRTVVPTYDFIGRYVGVKFLIIAPNSSHHRVQAMLGGLEKSICSQEFPVPGSTVRLGVKVSTAETEQRYETLKALLLRLERNALKPADGHAAKLEGHSPEAKPEAAVSACSKPEAAKGAATTGNNGASGGKTVLVLGSDPVDRVALARRIASLGYATEQASTPNMALEVLRGEKHVDLLLLDMRFPNPAELDIVAALKEAPEFCKLPVIVAAAQPIQMTVGRAQTLKVASYMGKPVDPAKLTQVLKQLVGAPQPKTPPEASPARS
jgi:diguanylate cyclase (GGDEF)-like protein